MTADLFDAPTEPLSWFAWRLSQHDVRGVAASIEAIRAAILEHGLGTVICGASAPRKPETYAERFERLLGEPLTAPTRKRKI